MRAADYDSRTIAQPIGAIHDDNVSRRKAALYGRNIAVHGAQGDTAHRYGPAGVHKKHEVACRTVLDGGDRNSGLLLQRVHQDFDVDELLREEMAVAVVEKRADFHRARR